MVWDNIKSFLFIITEFWHVLTNMKNDFILSVIVSKDRAEATDRGQPIPSKFSAFSPHLIRLQLVVFFWKKVKSSNFWPPPLVFAWFPQAGEVKFGSRITALFINFASALFIDTKVSCSLLFKQYISTRSTILDKKIYSWRGIKY